MKPGETLREPALIERADGRTELGVVVVTMRDDGTVDIDARGIELGLHDRVTFANPVYEGRE